MSQLLNELSGPSLDFFPLLFLKTTKDFSCFNKLLLKMLDIMNWETDKITKENLKPKRIFLY